MPTRSRLTAFPARALAALLRGWALAALTFAGVGTPVAAGAPEAPRADAEAAQRSDAELEELVAPIALYPDELLAITLPASTFPIQIVQAARFLEKRKSDPDLEPDESWDESVLGLLNYPDVVDMMNQDLDWTWKLGEAVVAQQPAVMDAIQRFRAKVDSAGNLQSNDKMVVEKKTEGSEQIIVIQSASPEVIYVPTYQPATVVVHQPAPYAYVYSPPYPYYYSPAAAFWTGMFVGAAVGYGMHWGYGHYHSSVKINHNVNIDVNRPGRGWSGGESWKPPANRPYGGRPAQQPRTAPAPRPTTAGGARAGAAPRPTAGPRATAQPRGNAAARPTPSGRDFTRSQPRASAQPRSTLGSYGSGSAARMQGARGASSRGMSRGLGGGGVRRPRR